MKNFIVLICLIYSNALLVAQNRSYFSFDRIQLKQGKPAYNEARLGYYTKFIKKTTAIAVA